MNRRNLLLGILAAPAIVRAESLMPIYTPPLILTGNLDVCEADIVEAAWAGRYVLDRNGRRVGRVIEGQQFRIMRTVTIPERPEGVWCGLVNCAIYGPLWGRSERSHDAPWGLRSDVPAAEMDAARIRFGGPMLGPVDR